MQATDQTDVPPFIIWTLRRTGGTTLAQLMMEMSPSEVYRHEPFNFDRPYGWVGEEWSKTKDLDLLQTNVNKAFEELPLIKTAYEMQGVPINKAIMRTAIANGYRHVVLDRRAEVDRLLSLELAKQTGVWGKMGAQKRYAMYESGEAQMEPFDIDWLLRHLAYCRKLRGTLQQIMIEMGVTPFVVYFEDVYTDHMAGRKVINRLVRHLGLPVEKDKDYHQKVGNALKFKGQNSARMMDFVPNIAEARAALEAAAEPYDYSF